MMQVRAAKHPAVPGDRGAGEGAADEEAGLPQGGPHEAGGHRRLHGRATYFPGADFSLHVNIFEISLRKA